MGIAEQIRRLVQEGRLEEALKMLNDWAAKNDNSLHNTTILLLSRFNQLKRNQMMGIINDNDADRNRNQLTYAVLSTLDDLPKEAIIPPAGPINDPLAPQNNQKKVFISYAREDRPWVDKLERHLVSLVRKKLISSWSDSKLIPGDAWDSRILDELRSADIILFLVSADFLSSDYIYQKEVPEAMRLFAEENKRVVPVILRACKWEDEPFARFNALPANALPITKWADEDEALLSVVEGIAKLVT